MLCFNDSILSFYLVACVYAIAKNWPLLGAGMLTLAISIKAGGVLMLPAFLGWVQY